MIIRAYNENHKYILFIDLEFVSTKEGAQLVQFAGLLFKRIDFETYQLMHSYNFYVTGQVCYPFMEYTSITNNFLAENGIPLKDVITLIDENLVGEISLDEVLLVSHGLKNDRITLEDNGIFFRNSKGNPVDGYCTFTNARRILKRTDRLTLTDVCEDAGYYVHNAHNAYTDVWAEVAVFTYLRKIEKQES